MPNFSNYYRGMNWDYSPAFKSITVSTKRHPAQSGGRVGSAVSHLTNVTSSPLILSATEGDTRQIRQAIGLEGTATKIWQLRMHKHIHTDDGVSVNQLPDIKEGDKVTINSIDYEVRWADTTHPFGFGDILILYVTEDNS